MGFFIEYIKGINEENKFFSVKKLLFVSDDFNF